MELFARHTYMLSIYGKCMPEAKIFRGLKSVKSLFCKKGIRLLGLEWKSHVFWTQTSAVFICPGYWSDDVRKWVRKKQYEVSMALWQKLHVYKAVTGLLSSKESSLTPHRHSKAQGKHKQTTEHRMYKNRVYLVQEAQERGMALLGIRQGAALLVREYLCHPWSY